jgi:YEATS domain-containing protein 4
MFSHPRSRSLRRGEPYRCFTVRNLYLRCRWGEFEVQIRITFVPESGEKGILISHFLKIHPWSINPRDTGRDWFSDHALEEARRLGPVHSWQYDEIVFNDPYQGFFDKLLQNPPTPLPKTRRRPIPFHLANPTPADFEASQGGMPEFTMEMAKQEETRLMAAVDAVIAEQERWQNQLSDKEAELEMLKRQLDD